VLVEKVNHQWLCSCGSWGGPRLRLSPGVVGEDACVLGFTSTITQPCPRPREGMNELREVDRLSFFGFAYVKCNISALDAAAFPSPW
jgi:hypothetical protein